MKNNFMKLTGANQGVFQGIPSSGVLEGYGNPLVFDNILFIKDSIITYKKACGIFETNTEGAYYLEMPITLTNNLPTNMIIKFSLISSKYGTVCEYAYYLKGYSTLNTAVEINFQGQKHEEFEILLSSSAKGNFNYQGTLSIYYSLA